MKRFISLLLAVLLIIGLCACSQAEEDVPRVLQEKVNIGVLKGPTGIGMAKLFGREDEGFIMSLYDSADQVSAKLLNGELDIAAMPSNLAAILYNKTGGSIKIIAQNCGGTLYLLKNSEDKSAPADIAADLAGKTVFAAGQGGVPQFVLEDYLKTEGIRENVNVQWLSSHADVVSMLMRSAESYAILPEPFVTMALQKLENNVIAVDLNDYWKNAYGAELPMGVLAARSDYIDNHEEDLATVLKDAAASVLDISSADEAAGEAVAAAGIIENAGLAQTIIPRCGIMMEYGGPIKGISDFFEVLYSQNPASVGGALPGDDIFCTLEAYQLPE